MSKRENLKNYQKKTLSFTCMKQITLEKRCVRNIVIGNIYTYDSHGMDSTYNHLSGKDVVVIRKLSKAEVDSEVGNMFEVEFTKTCPVLVIHAFEDELVLKKSKLLGGINHA